MCDFVLQGYVKGKVCIPLLAPNIDDIKDSFNCFMAISVKIGCFLLGLVEPLD